MEGMSKDEQIKYTIGKMNAVSAMPTAYLSKK